MADQKIISYLWFENRAEEAINFYTSVFPNSKILSIQHYPNNVDDPHMKGMEGKILNGIFELNGQRFMAIDGGAGFTFNESISFYVDCENQEEVDYYWEKLSAVPEAEQCGWVKDKFGLSWQIIPRQLGQLMSSQDPEKSKRVTEALLSMKKIIVADLQKAYDGQ